MFYFLQQLLPQESDRLVEFLYHFQSSLLRFLHDILTPVCHRYRRIRKGFNCLDVDGVQDKCFSI
jgi:hypothetical protein